MTPSAPTSPRSSPTYARMAARVAALLLAAAPLAPAGLLVPTAQAAPAAAVPVALPVGQKPADWAEALEARGLVASRVAGLPMAGPGVSLVDRKDYWEMTVRDRKGGTQTVNVAPCITPEEREDLLFYATTLLGPAPAEVVAVVPPPSPTVTTPPPTAPTTTTTAPTKAPTPPPTTTASSTGAKAPPRETGTTGAKAPPRETGTTGASSAAVPVTPTPTTTTVPTRAPERGPGVWIAAGGGVGIRSAAGAVGDFHLDGGWYVTRQVRLGLGVGARTAATLLEAGDGRAMGDVDLIVEAAYGLPLAPVTPYLGVYTGVGIRSFTDEGEPVLTAPVPLLGGEVGVNVPLGKLPLQIAPAVRVQGDLRSIELRSAAGLTPISPVEIRAGVSLVYRPG